MLHRRRLCTYKTRVLIIPVIFQDRNECQEPNTACQNGGVCTDKNPGFDCECDQDYVGTICEYIKGSCDFDDSDTPLCQYTNEDVSGNCFLSNLSLREHRE